MPERNELDVIPKRPNQRHRTLLGQVPGVDYAPVTTEDDEGRLSDVESEINDFSGPKVRQRSRRGYLMCAILCGVSIIVGIVAVGLWIAFPRQLQVGEDDTIDAVLANWGKHDTGTEQLARYPTDFLRDVVPIPCHSHNDYWRDVPLFSALRVGCTGVEADVWMLDNDPQIYVGHERAALTSQRTLEALYINPLVKILDRINQPTSFSNEQNLGVFDQHPKQTLVFMIDIKSDGVTTLQRVIEQLQPLRERGWLSYFKDGHVYRGPITIVVGGHASFDIVVANTTYRDYFFDAPLEKLSDDSLYDHTNSYMASVSFKEVVGSVQPGAGTLTSDQRRIIEAQLQAAQAKHIKARYWDTPGWPIAVRNKIWHQLVEMGVDYLNADDLHSVGVLDW